MYEKPDKLEMSVEELIQDTGMGRPHVVILGAGASLAAFPKGDKNGKKLPLMKDFVEVVGLTPVLKNYGISYKGENFEDIYCDLYENTKYKQIAESIELHIMNYFRSLELPPHPTIYDHLVLSLREKDIIATFNWDPLLYQACWRNHEKATLPHTVYLHGNVSIGYCLKDMQMGMVEMQCPKCGSSFKNSKILFPIKKKNYNVDPVIQMEWKALSYAMEHAYLLTIFGYGAPESDIEAINLMKKAWGSVYKRNLEQTEIIDTKNPKELRETWNDFIHTHHYYVWDNFYKSSIALFPRRTCEAEWNASMECRFLSHNPIPKELDFPELWKWYERLVKLEK